MELIKRYVYAVTRELPASQRPELEREINGLISDMLEARGVAGTPAEADVKAVLTELGDPKALADQYRGHGRYLIGPDYFHQYLSILKIVLMAVILSMGVVFLIEIINHAKPIVEQIGDLISSIFEAALQGFAWVTLTFVAIEYYSEKKGKPDTGETWQLKDLPELPDASLAVGRVGTAIEIIISFIILALVATSMNYFGVWSLHDSGGTTITPFFNMSVFNTYLPYVLAFLGFGILKDILVFIQGRWTLTLVLLDIAESVIGLVLTFIILTNPAIWNPDFLAGLTSMGMITPGTESYEGVTNAWTQMQKWILLPIAGGYLLGLLDPIKRLMRLLNNR